MIPFLMVEPELGARETRVLYVLAQTDDLPTGSYGLLEIYCPDPECDCRRVLIKVVEERQPGRFLASISYAFDEDAEMAGPLLDPINPQSEYAEVLLDRVERFALTDADYVVAMDTENVYHLRQIASRETLNGKLYLLLDFAPPGFPQVVPDPIYDGKFEHVYHLVEAGCDGLLKYIRAKHGL